LTTVSSQDAARPGIDLAGRLLEAARRRRFWRVAAVLAAVVLAASLLAAVPGSVAIVKYAPGQGGPAATSIPAWARTCLQIRYPSLEEHQLAFCARVDGRVIGSVTKSNGETHLLVTGGLHFSVVELKPGMRAPGWGSRITAVGPMGSGEGGFRELKALHVSNA
jgi:hypothetical protein